MWRLRVIVLVISSFVLLMCGSARADFILTPVSASDGTTGYFRWGSIGSGPIVNVSGNPISAYYNFSSSTYYTDERIILEFPLAQVSSLTEGVATLRIYFHSASAVNITYAGDGDGAVTYLESGGTTFVPTYSQALAGWASFDVTSQMHDAIGNGYDLIKFGITYTGPNAGSATISSSESGAQSPLIVMTPEPGTATLLGVLCLAWLPRRRRVGVRGASA